MPQPLQIGWIDYGHNDRNKILSVLSLLSVPEAVDELGVGVVRDAFSDLLFPGTSTVQTRAKYFFIVPYILMELEKEKNLNARSLIERLAKEELSLIPILKNSESDGGVIGGRSGERLQRKPSSIYWNGLYTYGILHTSTRLSVEGYAKAVSMRLAETKSVASFGHNDKGEGTDDNDAASKGSGGFWRVPHPPANWREDLCIALNEVEAQHLKRKITQSPHSKSSLFAHLLSNNLFPENFDDIDRFMLPADLRADYQLAQRFSEFVYGASIRYNVILSHGENEEANSEWEHWFDDVNTRQSVLHYDTNEAFARLSISGRNRARLQPFLNRWKQAVISANIEEMDNLIRQREIELKGKERAKLTNQERSLWQQGMWIGGRRLQYRYRVVNRFIEDIREGAGENGA